MGMPDPSTINGMAEAPWLPRIRAPGSCYDRVKFSDIPGVHRPDTPFVQIANNLRATRPGSPAVG